MKRFAQTMVLFALLAVTQGCTMSQVNPLAAPDYPPAERLDLVEIRHGIEISDPYRWLEDEHSDKTQTWVDAESALTQKALAKFEPDRKKIAAELKAVFGVDSLSNLYPYGERYFFLKRDGLSNHSSIYVLDGGLTATPKLVLNPNTFSDDGTVAMDWWYPSPDGSLIAYGKSKDGSEKSTLYIRNIDNGEDLDDIIPFTQYCEVAWNADGTGFYYNRSPDPATVPEGEENFHMRVYYHQIGDDWKNDRYVWGEGRPIDEEPRPYASSDHSYVLLNFYRDPSVNDLFFGPMNSTEPLKPVAARIGTITEGDVIGDTLYVLTNLDAPRFRICKTDIANPTPEYWKELVPQQKGVITQFKIIGNKLVVLVSENVQSRLMICSLDGKFENEIPLPGPGTVNSLSGSNEKKDIFFSFSSWVMPKRNYRYDLERHQLALLNEAECPVDLSKYETKQIWCTSKDGTKVPMFVVARKGIKLDNSHPTLLYGYGGFNVSFYPYYRPRIIPFLDRGGVWVLANIRGGGEFGQEWHDKGRRQYKQNGYNDFYAAAEKLIDLGYTRPSKLACKGGSNGGLLIGVAVTQRPDLFQAGVSEVPLMDMFRFNLWGMGAQWIYEYGNPDIAEEFHWLKGYSPYHNVHKGTNYPATLVVTAESDNRVYTAHALKMVAALQWATSGNRPILLRYERSAGHGAGKPLSMRIQHESEDWVFIMWQLGMLQTR